MVAEFEKQRVIDLNVSIEKAYAILKDIEDSLILEDDPKRRAKYSHDIDIMQQTISKFKDQLYVLQENRIDNSPSKMKDAADKIQQLDEKTKDLKKLIPNIWHVPPDPNPTFTDRDEILSQIGSELHSKDFSNYKQVLYGLGGVGKTQLALKYVYDHRSDYDLVWWLRSEESTRLADDYISLAEELSLGGSSLSDRSKVIESLRSQLEHQSNWLLVFDYANDPTNIERYLPRGGLGHVIVTSRNPNWLNVARVISVRTFKREKSVDFFLKRWGQERKDVAEDRIKVLDKLAEELGDLPLALEQAAAFIQETATPVEDYLTLFKSKRRELLDPIAITWELSLNTVEKESPLSSAILSLFSFLGPENIPRSLLVEHSNKLPKFMEDAINDKISLANSIRLLRSYSLIEATSDDFSIHRLVQDVTHNRLSKEDKEIWLNAALALLNDAFVIDSHDPKTLTICSSLFPHAKAVTRHSADIGTDGEMTVQLLIRMGYYLHMLKELSDCKSTLEQALMIQEKLHGKESDEYAKNLRHIGDVLREMGDLNGAEEHYQEALSIHRNLYGKVHSEVAADLDSIGRLMSDKALYDIAKTNFKRALNIHKKLYGPRDQKVAKDLSNLGDVLRDTYEIYEAKKFYKKALDINIKRLGSDHIEVANLLNKIGILLRNERDLEGAMDHFKRAHKIHENRIGPKSLEAAKDLNNIGSVLKQMGDLKGAMENFKKSLSIKESIYVSSHPEVARDYNNIGSILMSMDDLKGAKENFDEALKINWRFYGPYNPEIALSMGYIAQLLRISGDLKGSKDYFEKSLAINEKIYGFNHPSVAKDLRNLGSIMRRLGDMRGAKEKFIMSLKIDETIYGRENRIVLLDRNPLGSLLKTTGNVKEAKDHFKASIIVKGKIFGSGHPEVAKDMNSLGFILKRSGDLEGARKLFEDAAKMNEDFYGRDHGEVARDANNIGKLLKKIGNIEESKSWFSRALEIDNKIYGPEHIYSKLALNNLTQASTPQEQSRDENG